MANALKILVVIIAALLAPRIAVAQTASTTQAPCINGRRELTVGTAVVRVPCRQGVGVSTQAAAPVAAIVGRPGVLATGVTPITQPPVVVTPTPAPLVRPAPAPSGGAWERIFAQREAAQLERLRTAPRPYAPPPEDVATEPSRAPAPVPLPALPRTEVHPFPVWFVGIDGLARDGITPQAIVCVGSNAHQARIENMDETTRRAWCREWAPQLSNSGSQPMSNREERPGTANGRQADILIPRTPEWANAVVTMYGRTDQGDWRYVNQRFITERDPGASINAMDLLGSEVHNLLPEPRGLPAARAVATRHGHGRSHGRTSRSARRVRHARHACR